MFWMGFIIGITIGVLGTFGFIGYIIWKDIYYDKEHWKDA